VPDDRRYSEETGGPEGGLHGDAPRRGLARTIAKVGYATRRQAEEMVRSGRVTVDGRRELDPGATVTPESMIAIDDHQLIDVIRTYLALHKPEGISVAPVMGRRVRMVAELLPRDAPGLRAAGRLDTTTSGLLLVSNDSAWNAAAAGGDELEKEYLIRVGGPVTDALIDVIGAGVTAPKLGLLKPELVALESREDSATTIRIALRGGKVRQLRSLCTVLRLDLQDVHRVRVGPVLLGGLKPGRYRHLSRDEVEGIRRGPA
jgi:pseudouridine synthase